MSNHAFQATFLLRDHENTHPWKHLGSNPKMHLDVSYPYTKFGGNRPKQNKKLVSGNQKFMTALWPAADSSITITWFSLKTQQKHNKSHPIALNHSISVCKHSELGPLCHYPFNNF